MFANNHLRSDESFFLPVSRPCPRGRLSLLFAPPSTFHYRKYHKYQSFFSTPCVFLSIFREKRLDPVRSAEKIQSISRDFVVNPCQVKRIYQRAVCPSRPCFSRNFAIQHATEKYTPAIFNEFDDFSRNSYPRSFSAKGTGEILNLRVSTNFPRPRATRIEYFSRSFFKRLLISLGIL